MTTTEHPTAERWRDELSSLIDDLTYVRDLPAVDAIPRIALLCNTGPMGAAHRLRVSRRGAARELVKFYGGSQRLTAKVLGIAESTLGRLLNSENRSA